MTEFDGTVDPRFRLVSDVFAENFAHRGELGAAVAVTVGGRLVVDLWGGIADKRTRRPWRRDTMSVVFSCTKAATALCAHLLAASGQLDLEAPVARYWPKFAAAGKERLPVGMLLNHQAGLPAIDKPLPPDALLDWDTMTAALAAQRPHWSPGLGHGYHAMTFGWLVGEVVRRISGKTLGRFFRDEIGDPLGLDFWIGLPAELEPRVATIRMAAPPIEITPILGAMADSESLTSRAFLNPRGMLTATQVNSRAIHAAEIPAANGITSARSLAGMYTPLAGAGGRFGSGQQLDRGAIEAMSRVESAGIDRILLIPTRFSAGFMKSVDNAPLDSARLGPNPEAFGHAGAGGSIGMADPIAGVAIGYVMNQMGAGILLNERGQSLIDAVYKCLGA